MISSAYIFRTTQEIPGLFDTLFGGIFFVKGIPLVLQLAILVLIPAAVLLLVAEASTKNGRRFGVAAQVCAVIAFTFIVLFLLTPWDELFINLRHALNFAEAGTFSFNQLTRLEGTDDFLPYFLIGCLAKLGLPVIELAFLMSYTGGLLCLFAGKALVTGWGLDRWRSRAFVGLSLYAPLAFNSAHGFSSAVFTACALWGIYYLFFSPKRAVGLALLALLPLIRIEGLLLVWLLWGLHAWERKSSVGKSLLALALVCVPAAILSAWRLWYFGSAIPLPIQFKSSLGSLFYLLVGIRNFVADLSAGCGLAAIAAIALTWCLVKKRGVAPPEGFVRRGAGPLICLFLFVLPYYSSGGDWFPSYWGRYMLPFSLYAVLFAVCLLVLAVERLPRGERSPWLLCAVGIAVFQVFWPISSYAKLQEGVFTHRRILAKLFDKKTGRGHYRIQHLSQLGNHLARTTRESDVIASSEIATIMYFAHRETLDTLGLVNPEIVKAPLRPAPAILRKFPTESELPFLIFKRLKPDLLAEHRPQIVYTFDFILRDLDEELPFEEVTDTDIFRALGRWEYNLKGLIDPLYGGVPGILKLGYVPVIVLYRNAFCSMYFVSAEALPSHLERLLALGFTGGLKRRAD